MTAREQLHAALSLLGRTTDADRLIADRDAEQLGEVADLFESYGRAFLDGGIMTGFDAAKLLREHAAERGKDTGASSTIPAAVGESTCAGQACTVSGCGSLDGYLDTTVRARAEWTQIRTGSSSEEASRWYHSAPCAASALTGTASPAPALAVPVRQCAACGCTQDNACPGGCHWQPTARMEDLCSACVGPDGLCTTPDCGTPATDLDTSDPSVYGWQLLEIAGTDIPGRWVCSLWCYQDRLDALALEITDADHAAAITDAAAQEDQALIDETTASALVVRYRAVDGQEFVHTGEQSMGGDPLYAEARVDLPTAMQCTSAQLTEAFGELTVIETAATPGAVTA